MHSSRRHLYCAQNYSHTFLIFAFLRWCASGLKRRGSVSTIISERNRASRVLLLLCFFLFLSFPLFLSLFRNYQWERSQAPTAIVPDLIGLPLQTGTERSHSLHLETKVLGSTWYTNLSPGRITLQSPEAGQRVPYQTAIGVEVATAPPVLAPLSPQIKNCLLYTSDAADE